MFFSLYLKLCEKTHALPFIINNKIFWCFAKNFIYFFLVITILFSIKAIFSFLHLVCNKCNITTFQLNCVKFKTIFLIF